MLFDAIIWTLTAVKYLGIGFFFLCAWALWNRWYLPSERRFHGQNLFFSAAIVAIASIMIRYLT